MNIVIPTLAIVVFAIGVLIAQPTPGRTTTSLPESLQSLFGIVHSFPASHTPDSSWWIIGYRLVGSKLFFVDRNYPRDESIARYTLTIELRDTLGVVRFARVFHDSLVVTTKPAYTSELLVTNVDRVLLANGTYTVSIDVAQQQRQRMVWQAVFTANSTPDAISKQSFTFCEQPSDSALICLRDWGRVIAFGTRRTWAIVLVPRRWSGRDKLSVSCRLSQQYYPFYRGSDTLKAIGISLMPSIQMVLPNCRLEPAVRGLRLCCQLLPNEQWRLVLLELDCRQAIPGDYELVIVRGVTSDTLTVPLRIQWFAPPPHLFLSRYAVEVMRYVLTDDEYKSMLHLPDSVRTSAVIQWWKNQDPTPVTMYNEAMVEYFQRAFDARTLFVTAQESDGALTERGKVYLLFGKPSRIETNLEPGKAGKEIWYYTNAVRKRFTFEITEQGRYRLVKEDSF